MQLVKMCTLILNYLWIFKGAGLAFIGNKADKKSSEEGKIAEKLFVQFMKG